MFPDSDSNCPNCGQPITTVPEPYRRVWFEPSQQLGHRVRVVGVGNDASMGPWRVISRTEERDLSQEVYGRSIIDTMLTAREIVERQQRQAEEFDLQSETMQRLVNPPVVLDPSQQEDAREEGRFIRERIAEAFRIPAESPAVFHGLRAYYDPSGVAPKPTWETPEMHEFEKALKPGRRIRSIPGTKRIQLRICLARRDMGFNLSQRQWIDELDLSDGTTVSIFFSEETAHKSDDALAARLENLSRACAAWRISLVSVYRCAPVPGVDIPASAFAQDESVSLVDE